MVVGTCAKFGGAGLWYLQSQSTILSHNPLKFLSPCADVLNIPGKNLKFKRALPVTNNWAKLQHPDIHICSCRGAVEDLSLTGSKLEVKMSTEELQKAEKLV